VLAHRGAAKSVTKPCSRSAASNGPVVVNQHVVQQLAVGLAFNDQFPRRALQPVDGGLSEERIGQGGQPFNWNWHRFVWMDLPCWLGKRVPFHDPRFSR
jgi:hypothetical protein